MEAWMDRMGSKWKNICINGDQKDGWVDNWMKWVWGNSSLKKERLPETKAWLFLQIHGVQTIAALDTSLRCSPAAASCGVSLHLVHNPSVVLASSQVFTRIKQIMGMENEGEGDPHHTTKYRCSEVWDWTQATCTQTILTHFHTTQTLRGKSQRLE